MSKPTDQPNNRGIKAPGKWRDIEAPNLSTTGCLTHPITVSWGDCDPAQIAYTANIPAWGLLAVEAWYKACLGINWYELNLHHGIGTPFVSLRFTFTAPIKPLTTLDIDVYVSKLGNSSLSHHVEGYQAGNICCHGTTTAAFVNAQEMKPMRIPSNMRSSIEHYVSVQGSIPCSAAAEE